MQACADMGVAWHTILPSPSVIERLAVMAAAQILAAFQASQSSRTAQSTGLVPAVALDHRLILPADCGKTGEGCLQARHRPVACAAHIAAEVSLASIHSLCNLHGLCVMHCPKQANNSMHHRP